MQEPGGRAEGGRVCGGQAGKGPEEEMNALQILGYLQAKGISVFGKFLCCSITVVLMLTVCSV